MTFRNTWMGFAACLAALSIAGGYTALTPKTEAALPPVAAVESPPQEKTGDPAVDCVGARPLKAMLSSRMSDISAVREQGGFRVKGKVFLTNRFVGSHFFWAVRIAPAKGYRFGPDADPNHPFVVVSYADRTFDVPLDEEVELKFDETIFPQLPAGDYYTEIHLIHLMPGMTLESIRDNDHMINLSTAQGSMKTSSGSDRRAPRPKAYSQTLRSSER